MRDSRPVLLIDDDDVDAEIIKRSFTELQIKSPLIHFSNGPDALEYLRNSGIIKPALILLDLHMSEMSGIEFLKKVKSDENLKKYPVVVLTTSNEKSDKAESFELSVAGYVVKAINRQNFVEAIRTIDYYWTMCELPS